MVRGALMLVVAGGLVLAAQAGPLPAPSVPSVPQAPVPVPVPVWAPACGGLAPGMVVRSARPQKDGGGTERRRFWRGHWRVTMVLAGGRFLAEPIYRKDDTTGEIDRAAFAAFPGEVARTPPGALACEAFVTE